VTLNELIDEVAARGAGLVVRDGGLVYLSSAPLAPDDPLRADIAEHRAMLIELFTFAREGRCSFDGCYRLRAVGGSEWCPDHQQVIGPEDAPHHPLKEDHQGAERRAHMRCDDPRLLATAPVVDARRQHAGRPIRYRRR